MTYFYDKVMSDIKLIKRGNGMQVKRRMILLLPFFIISIIIAGCGGGSGDSAGGGSVLNTGFSKSISLAWDNPTTNIDGSSLTDLAGYKIHYGQAGDYTNVVDLGNATTYTINNLVPGTWCFSISAYDLSGNESNYSNEVCTVI